MFVLSETLLFVAQRVVAERLIEALLQFISPCLTASLLAIFSSSVRIHKANVDGPSLVVVYGMGDFGSGDWRISAESQEMVSPSFVRGAFSWQFVRKVFTC